MTLTPAGKISRKARLDRDIIPSFARLYRARGTSAFPDAKSWIIVRIAQTWIGRRLTTGERNIICHVYGSPSGPLKVQGLHNLKLRIDA